MKIIPMPIGFGAEVHCAELNTIDGNQRQQLRAALLEHGLLVVRGQRLTPHQQVAVSQLFGALETFPPNAGQVAGVPQIFRVASRSGEGYVDVGRYWHSDGSFRDVPTPISIWYSVTRPSTGGQTLFTDLREAYTQLPESIKQDIGSLRTLHRNGVLHQLAMPHPATGETVLYLNVGLTSGIAGLNPEQGAVIIAALDRHLSREGATYTHHWQDGDLVIADNFRVAHRATPIGREQKRILDRTTVSADGVFWRAAA
jgi:taurine dioxygenase